jgi:membrane protein implicated in regulation of membrane protease activity
MTLWFRLKAALGGVGLVLGLAGMVLNVRPLVWSALVLLALAFLARLPERRERDRAANEGS